MAHRCKVCGEVMTYTVGEHYRDTGKGRVLYRDVRQYTCPNGCRTAFFDYRRAVPAHEPVRIFGFIPAPKERVNVEGPLLVLGLGFFTIVMIAAFLMSRLNVAAKVVAITLLVTFAVLLMNFMGEKPVPKEQGGDGDA